MFEYIQLFDSKYMTLCYLVKKAAEIDGEYVILMTIDEMVTDSNIAKRTLCRHIKSLESGHLIQKSKHYVNKYAIPKEVIETVTAIQGLIKK